MAGATNSADRIVLFAGATGVGKSSTNNAITGLPPATTREDEQRPEWGLMVSAGLSSCSEEVLEKGPVRVSCGLDPLHAIEMTVTLQDTPGVPDTQGRGVQFLDTVMQHARQHPPHGVVFAVDGSARLTSDLEFAVRCFKECFNNMLQESRLIIYVNKLPSNFALEEQGITDPAQQRQARRDKAKEVVDFIASKLLSENTNFSTFAGWAWNMEGSRDGVRMLKDQIRHLPANPMQAHHFRTWTEAEEYHKDILRDAENMLDEHNNLVANMEAQVREVQNDITWHENHIEKMKIAAAATAASGAFAAAIGAIFSFGIAAAASAAVTAAAVAGIEAAKKKSEDALPRLRGKKESLVTKIQHAQGHPELVLKEEKGRCVRLVQDLEALKRNITRESANSTS